MITLHGLAVLGLSSFLGLILAIVISYLSLMQTMEKILDRVTVAREEEPTQRLGGPGAARNAAS